MPPNQELHGSLQTLSPYEMAVVYWFRPRARIAVAAPVSSVVMFHDKHASTRQAGAGGIRPSVGMPTALSPARGRRLLHPPGKGGVCSLRPFDGRRLFISRNDQC